MARPKAGNPRTRAANVRLTEEERTNIEAAASAQGCSSLSEYFRVLHARYAEENGLATGLKRVCPRRLSRQSLTQFPEDPSRADFLGRQP